MKMNAKKERFVNLDIKMNNHAYLVIVSQTVKHVQKKNNLTVKVVLVDII